MTTLTCWNCAAAIVDEPMPLSRRAQCRACHAELHCCRLCEHYAPGAPDACTEERAEPPGNKDAANVCEWFRPTAGRGSQRQDAAARSRLESMFGAADQDTEAADIPAADTEDPAAAARARLDALFGGGEET